MSDNPFSLQGKTVLVTGATAGLGRQTAISVSQAGARVIISGRNTAKLDATFAELTPGADHLRAPAELTNSEDRAQLAAELPALDGIVHCAGLTLLHPFKFSTEKKYHEIYSINVEAPLFLTQQLSKGRKLNNGGSIVFISSISPNVGTKGHVIYAGSKAALHGMARVLAHELAPAKIRANCISPGMIKTEVAAGLAEQTSVELLAIDEKRYPFGYGEPEDVANAVIFFLSPASKWITGTNLIMDGGLM